MPGQTWAACEEAVYSRERDEGSFAEVDTAARSAGVYWRGHGYVNGREVIRLIFCAGVNQGEAYGRVMIGGEPATRSGRGG